MNPLMTAKEAAAFLNVCPATIYREASAGTLPHVRIGRSIRFSKDALDAYINSQATVSIVPQTTTVVRAPVTRL